MYKLLLVFRYLRRRAIAYFAAAGVALCVFMMLVAISAINGFLHKLHIAARGLLSDVIIQTGGVHGVPYYDELIDDVLDVEGVEAASPFIMTYGFIRVPEQEYFRKHVQIAGIRLPEAGGDAEAFRRTWPAVSSFEDGLFVQGGSERPTFDPPVADMHKKIVEQLLIVESILRREKGDLSDDEVPLEKRNQIRALEGAWSYLHRCLDILELADDRAAELAEKQLELIRLENAGEDTRRIEARIRELEARTIEPEPNRIILGMGIQSLFFRTDEGETIRIMGPGGKVVLYVFPIGERTLTNASPNIQQMTVVDDCTTDVYIFDSETVYVSFDALQRLNNMGAVERIGGGFEPARCSMINIKAAAGYEDAESIKQLRNRIRVAIERFIRRHPDMPEALQVLTWWEKQEKITAQLESQRVLLIMMLGIISLVSVLLMFVILYMVVIQKIRDIGVLKAVGASNSGVGMIFLQFGGIVGLIGAIIGAAGGCVFIHYINQIHDWLYDTAGLRVWTRESYMFDRIPAEIDPWLVVMMIVGAVAASVVGAVVPSVRAARMQPVEALRYE